MKINFLEKFTVSLGKRWTNRANLLFFDNHLIALGHLNRIADKNLTGGLWFGDRQTVVTIIFMIFMMKLIIFTTQGQPK